MTHTNIIINELNRMFIDFNAIFFESNLPEVEIVIQRKGKHKAYGWFTTGKIWSSQKHEITITAEHLDRGILNIASTLLHEMVHLSNWSRGIEDCSRNGTYHNKFFCEEANRIGLNTKHNRIYGYSETIPTAKLVEKIEGLKYIDVFKIKRTEEADSGNIGKAGKKSNIRKYTCPGCRQIARGSKEIYIICGHCSVTMIEN